MSPARATATFVLSILGFASALTGIWDPDFFHHLAVGRAVAQGVPFSEDPLLYPFAGTPASLPPYWLGSLLLYLSSLPHTWVGPQVLTALLTSTVCVLLLVDSLEDRRSWRDAAVAATLVLLAIPELRVRSAPRPEAFGILLVAWTLLALRRFERGHPRHLLAFPLVALVWNQLHVSVAIGIGLVALHLAWAMVRAWGARLGRPWASGATLRDARTPFLVVVAALLASALTPSYASPLRVAVDYLGSLLGAGAPAGASVDVARVVRGAIEELARPSLADWGRPFGILLAVAAALVAARRPPWWGRELATVVVLGWLASRSHRFAALAAVAAAPIAARSLLSWLDALTSVRPRLARALGPISVALGIARAATAPTLPLQPLTLSLDVAYFPVRAAGYLREIGFDGRLYNPFGAGGYLEWALGGVKVFQDGRGMLRPEDALDLFPEPIDRARLARLDGRWSFDAVVLGTRPPDSDPPELAARIATVWATAADPAEWSLVAMDEGASLFLRRQGRWADRAAKDELRLVRPGVIIPDELLATPAGTAGLAAELGRLVRESPECVRCRAMLAGTLLQSGRLDEASAHLDLLDRAGRTRERPTIDILLATRSQLQGDPAGWEAHFRDAIRRTRDPAPLRRALAMQLLSLGRDAEASALVAENLARMRSSADLGLAAYLARRGGDAARGAALEAEAERARLRELGSQPAPR